MSGDVEWVPPESTDVVGGADELFALGKEPVRAPRLAGFVHRVPPATRVLTLAVVVAVVIASLLATRGTHRSTPAAVTPHAPAAEQVATDRAIAMIEASARTVGPLQDYIRSNSTQGACALVAVGQSPQASIAAAIRRALPQYTVRDSSLTIDQFTALCAISVRAADASGSVLVVDVAAPQQAATRAYTALTVGARLDAANTVSIATALTRQGWSVTLGVVGPLSDEPSSADLQRLSQDAALLW